MPDAETEEDPDLRDEVEALPTPHGDLQAPRMHLVEEQGPELYTELHGEAWTHAEELDPETVLTEEGVTTLSELPFQRRHQGDDIG